MVLEGLTPLLRGFVLALLGVGFWVGGLLFFNWVWNHYRGGADDEADAGERPPGDNV